jgi:two-component system copper resistance phosphate regulon response regulator CusR
LRILVVEDEAKLLSLLERGLRSEGYAIDGAPTVAGAMGLLQAIHYDLALIDLLLTDGSGFELLRHIRAANKGMPVLVLTARGDIESKTEAFQLGADDYLTKPFELAELSLRVQALLRRAPTVHASELRVADLELNRVTRQVRRAGKRLELSPKEHSLLEYMLLHAGRTLTRSMIIEKVWDQSFEGMTNIVDVYVGHLRRKVDGGHEVKLIHTVRGIGYCLEEQESS